MIFGLKPNFFYSSMFRALLLVTNSWCNSITALSLFHVHLRSFSLHEVKNRGPGACEDPETVEEDGDNLGDDDDPEHGEGQLVVVVDNTRFGIIWNKILSNIDKVSFLIMGKLSFSAILHYLNGVWICLKNLWSYYCLLFLILKFIISDCSSLLKFILAF